MTDDLQEPLRRKVGGSLSRLPPLKRLEMLRQSAQRLRIASQQPSEPDGHSVRKTVGATR